MPSDPTKPLLKLSPQEQRQRPLGSSRFPPPPTAFPQSRQTQKFAPKFERLSEVLSRDSSGLELRTDPTALAPERLLVFEVRGALSAFAAAVQKIPGLELIDEEDMSGDPEDKSPVAYLMVPDARALKNIESLWQRWRRNKLVHGEAPWRKVFELLRDLRPWGPADRVQPDDSHLLTEEIQDRPDDDLVTLEIELVFRKIEQTAYQHVTDVQNAVTAQSGRVISQSRIPDIAYHALLVELPVRSVRNIIERSPQGIAGLDPVMHIRAQSIATSINIADSSQADESASVGQLGSPILALLDGVPMAGHALLSAHIIIDDQFELEANAPVAERVHGTAMASLIVHGDRNLSEASLPRQIHVVPVLGAGDNFPSNRLIVDVIYTAIVAMRSGVEPTAPHILIVNLSLGNSRRPFHGQLSPWARLLDRLAYRFGILFLVSAGNVTETFGVPGFTNRVDFEDAADAERATETIRAIGDIVADRRLFAPAETVNGITVGACNIDAVSAAERRAARTNIDPFPNMMTSNPSSALGPGFAASVKPDILMPGGREHLRVIRNHTHIDVRPAGPSRSAGIKVAAPPTPGYENSEGFTNGTSAGTALASRTCHRIHDALEGAYGQTFTQLSHIQRAVLLKALLVHPAKWSDEAASLIRSTIGPANGKLHVQQKDNIRRFLGYGLVDGDQAVACADDRATFWATGTLEPDKTVNVSVPIPAAIGGQARPHALSATLAWFTPVSPGRRSYRDVRLKLIEPGDLASLQVSPHSDQPDTNQSNRGTVFTRCWKGDRAPIVGPDMSITLRVERQPDQGIPIDEPVPFGLAVTLAMPGVIEIYEQVRQRLIVPQRAPVSRP